ncbi:MAG: tetratricopeptide repeat protein [Chromatiales bacterium]
MKHISSDSSHQAALLWPILSMLAILAGCTTALAPVVEPPVEEQSVSPPEALPPPERTEEARTYPLPDEEPGFRAEGAPPEGPGAATEPAPINSPAVVALLDQADLQAQSGEGDQAAATLERALRIEPHNPWLWHRLAVLRMQQRRYQDAIDLANKSTSLAAGNERLLAGNGEVIARCREALGNY